MIPTRAPAVALAAVTLAACIGPDATEAGGDDGLVAKAATVVSCRSTAPAGGDVARGLRALGDAVRAETDGRVELRWFLSASSDELVANHLREAGGCALLTTHDLAGLAPDRLALGLPGLYTSWADLDAARDAIRAQVDEDLDAHGMTWLGDVDIGVARVYGTLLTRGPATLRGRKAARPPADVVMMTTATGLGLNAILLGDNEVGSHLGRDVSTLIASSLRVQQRQWSARLEHALDGAVPWYESGSLVIAQPTLDALRPADRETVRALADVHTAAMSEDNRRRDASARAVLDRRLRVTMATPEERSAWADVLTTVRTSLLPHLSPAARTRICAHRRC